MHGPKLYIELKEHFKKLPGIGEKSAERMVNSILELNDDEVEEFSKCLVTAKHQISRCPICNHITDQELCDICRDETRNKNIICVIEDYKSIFAFENSGHFKGTYHVLNGLISPIDDIGPEDINLSTLLSRLEKLTNPELILALKPTIEGEATTLYIKKILENKNVTISRLSYGIPVGADIDYLDNVTLEKALEDRKILTE